MYDELFKKIMMVDFEQAEGIFLQLSEKEQKEAIEHFVYTTESMIFYSFIQYMNERNEKILFHEMEFDILTNGLCHIEGAYQIALYHNLRLLELIPNSIRYMEWMLSLYDVKVINKEKARSMAKKILELDKNNMNAKIVLDRLVIS